MADTSLISIIAVIVSAYFLAIGSVFLKKGSEKLRFNVKEFLKNKNLVIGSSIHLIAGFIFLVALRFNEVSVLYPFSATSYIWVTLMSRKYLYEHIGRLYWLGIGFITIGVVLIGFGSA